MANLISIIFPNSLRSIGSGAFTGCFNLTTVDLSQCSSFTTIENNAFRFCTGLTSVSFPNSLNSIGDYAFTYCNSLTSATLSNTSLTSIGISAFEGCSSLTTATFPVSLNSIGDYAFLNSGLTSITLPDSLITIGNNAFYFCRSLTSVTFPASLTSIGNGAFRRCGLQTLYFYGNPLPTIQSDSFQSIASGAIAYVSTPAYNNLANQATITSLEAQGIEVVIQCFLKGSKILTNKGYLPIEYLRKGDLVKTLKDDYQPIYRIGKKELYHGASQERWKNQLYVCKKEKYPELLEELVITGCHSILVDGFISAEEREKTIEVNGDTYVTDGKYRLPACVDERTEVYEKEGTYEIYHLALEHSDKYMNYGIYANGLLVETCSKRYLTELSEMEEVL